MKMVDEFKAFILKGNIVDMAIGVIVGSAFSSIVTSLVNDVLTPFLGLFLGGVDFSGLVITLNQDAVIYIGNFIQSIINFLITALCMFAVVKFIAAQKAMMEKLSKKKEEEEATAPAGPTTEQLLTEIRDLLAKQESK